MKQEHIDKFNNDLETECRKLWASVYAAAISGQSVQSMQLTGNWAADSSGNLSTMNMPGYADHNEAANCADIAVLNYRVMVGNKLSNAGNPYHSSMPLQPTDPIQQAQQI